MIYLITHGDRFPGANPRHTDKGIGQLYTLPIPTDISLVVVGTGARFREIYETIKSQIPDIPVKFSPFCGSVDGLDIDKNGNKVVVLSDGTPVDLKRDYISLSSPCFDAWRFIDILPSLSLLCAGSELMNALNLKPINEKGKLYELYPTIKDGRKIS